MAKKTKTIKIKKDVKDVKYVIVNGEIKKAIRIGASPVFNLGVKYKSAEDTEFYVDYDKQFETKEQAQIKRLEDNCLDLIRKLAKEQADREYEQGRIYRDIQSLDKTYNQSIKRLTTVYCALLAFMLIADAITIIWHFAK